MGVTLIGKNVFQDVFFPLRLAVVEKGGKYSMLNVSLVYRFLIINHCHAEYIKLSRPLLIFSQSDYLIQIVDTNSYLMANSADPDQLASSEANWSGFTLFAKAGHIQAQQDYG